MSTTESKRTIPLKPHTVRKNRKVVAIVYAPTGAGAIRDAKAAQAKLDESWEAELTTGEELFLAGKGGGVQIINAPASMREPEPQADAFDGDGNLSQQ